LAFQTSESESPSPVEDADVHASSSEYAARFAGSVGAWMLEVQERALLSMLDTECTSVLDVGGGHGQIALPLSRAHRSVTVLGSSPVCAERLREQIENGLISFKAGNLIEIPFEAKVTAPRGAFSSKRCAA
jgi:2-polyprenyl-3-methyl-5-hydroxy-6-metoxy-1,4-benzoquinol methylase